MRKQRPPLEGEGVPEIAIGAVIVLLVIILTRGCQVNVKFAPQTQPTTQQTPAFVSPADTDGNP